MEEIKKWLNDVYNSSNKFSINSCLFIMGNNGIGKTSLINQIITDMNLFKIDINYSNCNTSLNLIDILYKSYTTSLIQILTNNTNKKIIIIDDFDIIMSLDNTVNITLYNFIINNTNKIKNIPLIIITTYNNVKKLGEIKKKCKFIEIKNLQIEYIHNIFKSYNNNLTLNDAKDIIEKNNYNLNESIKFISNKFYNNSDKFINSNDLFTVEFNRNNIKQILYKEQWLIPINFHENIITELLYNRDGNIKDKDLFYKKFILNFCFFDIFMAKDNYISIDLFISIIKSLYDFKIKKCSKQKTQNFTKMLSYLSLQKKHNKYIYNKLSLPLNQIGNYHLNNINRNFIY